MPEQVTHEDLDRAAEETVAPEETSGEETDIETKEAETDETPDEPSDHKERSKLGRRVSELGERFENLETKILEKLDNLGVVNTPKEQSKQEEDPVYNPDDSIPLTMGELDNWYKTKRAEEAQQQDTYVANYEAQLSAFGDKEQNPELHQAVVDEMMANFNVKRSNDGKIDAQTNYLHAKVKVLEDQTKQRINPLDKNKYKQPQHLGGPSSTTTDSQTPVTPQLDEYAQDFVNYTRKTGEGMSDETIQKALTSDKTVLRGTSFSSTKTYKK